MRLFGVLSLWRIGVVFALRFPATIEVDLVFPQERTYNNMTALPVVFAIHNAEAAFSFGYLLSWRIFRRDPGTGDQRGVIATSQVRRQADQRPPADAVNNIWIESGASSNYTTLVPGKYSIDWEWSMVTCIVSGEKITRQIGFVQAQGALDFTLVGDGSGSNFTLNSECPVYQRLITAGSQVNDCPIMASQTAGTPDPCKAKPDEMTAACVMSNISQIMNPEAPVDGTACAKLRASAAKGSAAWSLEPAIIMLASCLSLGLGILAFMR
jgi:hypothetical protein